MTTCQASKVREQDAPKFYSLTSCVRSPSPRNLTDLKRWLTKNGREPIWDGKIYVARTIFWDAKSAEFRQTGCSPNYQAGWWSLACCKHPMRTAQPFRRKAADLLIPTYIFTLARFDSAVGQALVSVAEVTKHSFETMEAYAKFLIASGDSSLISSRLTRLRQNDRLLGWRFGDCHSNVAGDVGSPRRGHVHYPNDDWKTDISGKHLILLSSRFLLWPEPVFVATATHKRSRFGRDIGPATLGQLIHAA
jgi:hypothetical protein